MKYMSYPVVTQDGKQPFNFLNIHFYLPFLRQRCDDKVLAWGYDTLHFLTLIYENNNKEQQMHETPKYISIAEYHQSINRNVNIEGMRTHPYPSENRRSAWIPPESHPIKFLTAHCNASVIKRRNFVVKNFTFHEPTPPSVRENTTFPNNSAAPKPSRHPFTCGDPYHPSSNRDLGLLPEITTRPAGPSPTESSQTHWHTLLPAMSILGWTLQCYSWWRRRISSWATLVCTLSPLYYISWVRVDSHANWLGVLWVSFCVYTVLCYIRKCSVKSTFLCVSLCPYETILTAQTSLDLWESSDCSRTLPLAPSEKPGYGPDQTRCHAWNI